MTDRPDDAGITDPDTGESPFVGAPFVAQGEAMPGSPGIHGRSVPLGRARPGVLEPRVLGHFGTMFAEATYRFHATSSEMAVLGVGALGPVHPGVAAAGSRGRPLEPEVDGRDRLRAAVRRDPRGARGTVAPVDLGGGVPGRRGVRDDRARALGAHVAPRARGPARPGERDPRHRVPAGAGAWARSAGGWLLEAWSADAVYAAAAGAALLPAALHADGARRAPARRAAQRLVRRPAPRRADGLAPPDRCGSC